MFAIFYCHLEYFTDILDILLPFGTFCLHLVYFFGFGTKKNLATLIALMADQTSFRRFISDQPLEKKISLVSK
jgi:hypothetical protein